MVEGKKLQLNWIVLSLVSLVLNNRSVSLKQDRKVIQNNQDCVGYIHISGLFVKLKGEDVFSAKRGSFSEIRRKWELKRACLTA